MALTFVTHREKSYLGVVERTTKRKMEKLVPPTLDQALEGQQKAVVEKILQTIEANNLQYYKQAADELLDQQDASTVVAAVLKMLTKEPDTTPVRLTEESPLPQKRERKQFDRDQRRGGNDYNRKKGATNHRTGAKRSHHRDSKPSKTFR